MLEKIEAYLDGQLPREALESFAATAGVADLEREIEWVRDLRLAIEAEGVREQVARIAADPDTGNTAPEITPARWIPYAMAAALIVAAAIWWLLPDRYERLYDRYAYVDAGIPVRMGQHDQYALYDAMTYFGEGDYREAARRFGQLAAGPDKAYNDTVYYFLGASELYSGAGAYGKEALEAVANDSDSPFRQRAEWLLVLGAVREKDPEAIRSRLTAIVADADHPFHDRAHHLQQALP